MSSGPDRIELDPEVISASEHVINQRRRTRANEAANKSELQSGRFTQGRRVGNLLSAAGVFMLEGIDVVTLDLLKSNDRRLILAGVATFVGGIAGGYLRRNKRETEDAEVAKLGINQPAVETTAQPSPAPAG